MRAAISTSILLLTVSVSTTSLSRQVSDWMQRAETLGITSAHVILEYSLTDDCELKPVRIVENSSEKVFTAAAIESIVKSVIGPFEAWNRQLIDPLDPTAEKPENLAMVKRSFAWRTASGHSLIVCTFFADGRLDQAEFVLPNTPPAHTVPSERISQRLSDLPAKMRKVTFVQRE